MQAFGLRYRSKRPVFPNGIRTKINYKLSIALDLVSVKIVVEKVLLCKMVHNTVVVIQKVELSLCWGCRLIVKGQTVQAAGTIYSQRTKPAGHCMAVEIP